MNQPKQGKFKFILVYLTKLNYNIFIAKRVSFADDLGWKRDENKEFDVEFERKHKPIEMTQQPKHGKNETIEFKGKKGNKIVLRKETVRNEKDIFRAKEQGQFDSRILSPFVVIFTNSTSISGKYFFSCCATKFACHRANLLFRVPILIFKNYTSSCPLKFQC